MWLERGQAPNLTMATGRLPVAGGSEKGKRQLELSKLGKNRAGCVLPVGVNQEEGRLGQANDAEVTQDLRVAPATASTGFLALKGADGG